MASAALISYPHFKDLEKTNTDFVEAIPNLRKSRRLRSDKKEQLVGNHTKEQLNTECIITSERDRYSSLRIKNKEIEILPTLVENEEKDEESWMMIDNNKENKIQEILESPAIYETMGMHVGDAANLTNVNSKMQLKSKSNHSLVGNKSFVKQLSTENNMYDKPFADPRDLTQFSEKSKQSKAIAVNENKLKDTLCRTKHKPVNYCSDHNSPKNASNTVNNKPKKLNWEQNTLMPNTTELQGISLNESVKKLLEQNESKSNSNKEYISMPTYSKYHAKGYEPNSTKSYMPAWKLVLAVLWTITFVGALTYIIITNIDKKINVIGKPLKYDHTNYEIVLLIAKNFRRLIVSSFYAFG